MRIRTIILGAAMVAALLPGCSKRPADGGKGLHVLCSTFPMYVFTRNVTAGRQDVQVDLMIPGTTGCPHDYVLSPQDMQKIAGARVFIANGLGMEEFLGQPIKRANENVIVVDTSAGIGDLIHLKAEKHEDSHHHGDINPHLFASPRMAARIVRNIAAELSKADPAGAATYSKNADAYAGRLEKLADEFVAELKHAPNKKIVTEHAVFDYLARDCGLEIAAVIEENPGQAPGAWAMKELIQTIKSSGAASVFTEPQYFKPVCKTIADGAGIPVAALDPVASGPDDAPLDYYETKMRDNLATLVGTLKAK